MVVVAILGGLVLHEIQLRGDLPSPLNPPRGCRFHTRCAHAQAKCAQAEPEFEAASESHQVRCHFWRDLQPDRPAQAGSPLSILQSGEIT